MTQAFRVLAHALIQVDLNGRCAHEWLWRLVVDHGYKYEEIKPGIDAAHKRWKKRLSAQAALCDAAP